LHREKVDSIDQWKEKVQAQSSPKSDPAVTAAAEARVRTPVAAKLGHEDRHKGNNKRAQGLGDILKIDTLDEIPTDILVKMWAEHHETKDHYVSGAMEAPTYRTFRERIRQYSRVRTDL